MLYSPNNGFLANVQERLATRDEATAPAFPYPGATLLYVIDGPATADQQNTVLNVMYQRRGPGSFNKPKLADLSTDDIALAPPSDRRLLALLHGASRRDPHSSWPDSSASSPRRPATFMLPDPLTLELLPTIARSARAWLRPRRDSPDVEPLAWDDGPAWKFRLIIEAIEDGFHIDGELYRLETTVRLREEFLVLAGGLIAMRGALGRFEAAEDFAFLAELRRSGPVDLAPSDGPLLAYLLAKSGTEPKELPDTLRLSEVRVPPVPRLSLLRREDRDPGSLSAALSFDYDGTIVGGGPESTTTLDAAGQRVIHRQPTAEIAARARLEELGFRAGGYDAKSKPEIATRALPPAARILIREGWYVEADGVRYRVPTSLSLSVTSGVDWFDLDAKVAFGDMNVALAGILASAKPGGTSIRLGDGSVGLLPEDWLRRYAPLAATGEVEGERIRFRRSQAALLAALLADRDAEAIVRVDETFDLARRELAEFTHITAIEPPASFTGTLRPYQAEGLGWFQFLRRFGFGGCLADDMGLGKTVMVLALLESRRDVWREPSEPHLPSLIVVPRSLVGNWMAEAARFTPELRVLDYSHAMRSGNSDALTAHDVVIVTYGTLRRDITALSEMAFDYVVLDEAQAIKNSATASSKAARLLGARHRLALSGTPIENHLGELWSLFEFLNPGVLGRSSVFQRATAATTDGGSRETTHLLARGLRPFILRRTKQQVAHDLPARTEQTISCQLSSRERALYDSLRRHYRAALIDRVEREGLAKSKMHVLEALLRLRQAACHPGLVDPKRRSDASAKFEVLLPRLREVLAEGHKALVFSQFTTLLGLLRVHLDAEGVQYEYLDGTTKNRGEHVRRFQEDPGVGLFLISLKAGGLGLNLTAAEYVFLLDPWWNPAAEAQAIDRAHRIGQTREVFAYRLIAEQTVEDKVLALQQSKRALADAVLSADAVGLRHLGREDLEWLLS